LLSEQNHRIWTQEEAKLYFEWLMNVKDSRLQKFNLLFIGKNELLEVSEINQIAERVIDKVKESCTLRDGKLGPDSVGLSIAADFGLYIGEYCIKKKNDLKWGIVKNGKTDVSYNLPAIFKITDKKNYIVEPLGVTIRSLRFILNSSNTDKLFWSELIFSILGK
jgi:hypothetical protein